MSAADLKQRPVIRLAFFFPSEDATVVRDVTLAEAEAGLTPEAFTPKPNAEILMPEWCMDPRRDWDDALDPVTFSGVVRPNLEAEAWEVVLDKVLPEGIEQNQASG